MTLAGIIGTAWLAAQPCGGWGAVDFARDPRAAADAGLVIDAWVEDVGVVIETEVRVTSWGLGARSIGDRLSEVEVRPDGSREVLRIDLPYGGAERATVRLALLFGAGEPVAEMAEITAVDDLGGRERLMLYGVGFAVPAKSLDQSGADGSAIAVLAPKPGRSLVAIELRPVDGPPDSTFGDEEPAWGPDHAEFVLRSLSWTRSCAR